MIAILIILPPRKKNKVNTVIMAVKLLEGK